MRESSKPQLRAIAAVAHGALLALLRERATAASADVVELLANLDRRPLSLDPDDLLQSGQEAGLLLRIIERSQANDVDAAQNNAPTRAGYAVVGDRSSSETQVHPALLEALASGSLDDLRSRFSDLWAVDRLTWDHLGSPDAHTIAIAWLSSPGRRLLGDLRVLKVLRGDSPADWENGPTDFTPARLRAAIGLGASKDDALQSWHELHSALPSANLHDWNPTPAEVPAAMIGLEWGMPPMRRGAALAWLLERGVKEPIYEVGELTRDLRNDLPIRLASAFSRDGEIAESHRIGRKLESMLLQHVACMAATALQDWSVPDLWHLARWLHGVLVRSPWYGGDLLALVERLRAHLPDARPLVSDDLDPLHPARFCDQDDDSVPGLDPEEVAVVAGALRHYGQRSTNHWTPAPRPLVGELNRIAQRSLNRGESAAEESMARLQRSGQTDAMAWMSSLGPHVAPPLVARWILSRVLHAGWMHEAIEAGHESRVLETLELLQDEPERFHWVCFAWMEEGPHLPPAIRAVGCKAWRTLATLSNPPPAHVVAALGAGVLSSMSTEDRGLVIGQAQRAVMEWRPKLLGRLAQHLPPDSRSWSTVVELLLSNVADPDVDSSERVQSAIVAVRHLAATRRTDEFERLQRVADMAQDPPLSRHSGLRRELRRLGFTAQQTAREA